MIAHDMTTSRSGLIGDRCTSCDADLGERTLVITMEPGELEATATRHCSSCWSRAYLEAVAIPPGTPRRARRKR